MVLVSAILRTITQVLNSKAAFGPNFEVQPGEKLTFEAKSGEKPSLEAQPGEEELFENPSLLGQDIKEPINIFEDVNLAINDGDEAANTQPQNEIKSLTSIKKDEEPGEISNRCSDEVYSKKEEPVIELSDLNKAEKVKERVLSVTEQDHIISCLAKSVQLVSQLAMSVGQILSCEFCGFSTKGERQRRELRIHYERVHFICKLCGNKHLSKSDLKLHLENTHTGGSESYVCGIGGCKEREIIKLKSGEIKVKFPNLYTHIRKLHCTFKFSCNICDTQVATMSYLRDHISAKHDVVTGRVRSYKCPHCDKGVKNASSLQAHIDAMHTIRPYQKCPICEFVTQNIFKMRSHVKLVHLWEPQKCSSYDFETMNSETLKKHKNNERNKKLLCRYCNYKGKKPENLRRHILTHSDAANYICDQCDFRTKTPQSLKVHSLYHEAPKYICELCQYTSCSSANFSSHKKTKHGTTQYKCDQCGEIFQYLRHLFRHQDNHQALKFDCKICGKQFTRKDKLREHGHEVHDKIEVKARTKSISCTECGKTFTQSKHLSRHKASAHGGPVFNCSHCKKSFSRRDKMKTHMNYSCKQKPSNVASDFQNSFEEEFLFE